MKIVVCIKQVPAKDAPLSIDGNWIREADIGFEMNEPDSYALEEALRLKEKHGGEVIALSMGPERVKQTIKEALAKGADRAIHIADDQFAQLDPLGAAKLLAEAVRKETPDLILTGLQSDDRGFGQTGVLIAALLDLPHATIIMQIEVQGKKMRLEEGTGSRLVSAHRMPAARRPLHSIRHQQSPLRHPQRHHGRQEKRNRLQSPANP